MSERSPVHGCVISQDENNGYDTHDACVVAAESEDAARQIHPYGDAAEWGQDFSTWCKTPEAVKVELLGAAKEGTEAGVILASFNAG